MTDDVPPITYTRDGEEYKIEFEQIAGRGSVGNINWGASSEGSERTDLEPVLNRLTSHTDEPVLLTGGGGRGLDVALLDDAEIQEYTHRSGYKIRAFLTLAVGKRAHKTRTEFSPWLDSWQISVLQDGQGNDVLTSFTNYVQEQADALKEVHKKWQAEREEMEEPEAPV